MKSKMIVILTMLVFILGACGKSDKKVIRIGHKNYTEQRLLGQMASVLIENNTDYETEVKELGGTLVVDQAIKNNNLDISLEYSGIGYFYILKQDKLRDPKLIYNYIKEESLKNGITWLNPLGYNNTYSFGVTQETAKKYNLKKFSDFKGIAEKLSVGEYGDFFDRPDGMPGITDIYGFKFGKEVNLDTGLKYKAADQGDIDVVVVYTTDSLIEKYNLVVLEDDKHFFPHYDAIPRMRTEFAEGHPEVVKELEKLGNKFSEEDFRKYNYQIDVEQEDIKQVAESALREKGLIQ